MINYVLKDAPEKPFEVTTSQTMGSYGLFNSYSSIGGTIKKLKYFTFLQYRHMEGWRANSDQTQVSGYAKLQYDFTSKFSASVEYTLLRNKIHMPGGLTDSMFVADPKQSGRARNWLSSPWNILSSTLQYKFNEYTSLSLKSSYLFSERNLVWRNEDGWPDEKDTITPALTYVPREVEREYFKSITNELRFLINYKFLSSRNTMALGVRQAYSFLRRQEGADGTTGSNYDLTRLSDWPVFMDFYTTNIAPFIENTFNFGKLSITPGVRFEYLSTVANGYTENEGADSDVNPYLYAKNQTSTRTFLMSGAGLQYKFDERNNFYANYSQSYRPVTYSDLTPFGTVAKIDPHLKDAYADNADIGFRGMIKNILNYDVSVFYIHYKNRIGYVMKTQDTLSYLLRTNTGASENKGVEAYLECNINNLLFPSASVGKLSIYNSFAYVDARYVQGDYIGKQVEYAPKYINRTGLNYSLKGFSINAQYSYQASAYGDAANTEFSHDALVGKIPSYSLLDISASYKYKKYQFKAGVNNLADKKYFTLRTPEYPGPGIIPSNGRMMYAGISATF
jgi:Fe(3+) dicitrate transport protein